jgi:OOP family OmpA-OmpF porin
MRNRCMLGAGIALAVAFGAAQAHAQLFPFPGGPSVFYFGGEGGWTDLENQKDRVTRAIPAPPVTLSGTERFNDGYNVGGRAGLQWGPWRLEEEFNYRHNTETSFFGAGHGFFTGSRRSYAVMTNLLYDFSFGWPVTPHIGGGVGAVDVVDSVNSHVVLHSGPATIPTGNLLKGDDWEFGYQGIVGLEYNFNPTIALDVDYRYLGTTDPSFRNKAPGIASVVFPHYKSGYSTHNLVASLIVRFGPPPPPPVAPPAAAPAPPPPPPPQVYLVFFDWDRYNITPEGAQVIRQAADHWRAGGQVQIQVTGYTDLSGSPGYNQRLSVRRANAVANVLVRDGVPRNAMVVTGRGMNNPRVPTARGVREPQNRRVEIVFP